MSSAMSLKGLCILLPSTLAQLARVTTSLSGGAAQVPTDEQSCLKIPGYDFLKTWFPDDGAALCSAKRFSEITEHVACVEKAYYPLYSTGDQGGWRDWDESTSLNKAMEFCKAADFIADKALKLSECLVQAWTRGGYSAAVDLCEEDDEQRTPSTPGTCLDWRALQCEPPTPTPDEDPCLDWPEEGSTGIRWMFGTNYRVMTKLVMSPDGETLFVGSGDEHLYALYPTIATSPRRRRHSKSQKKWDYFTPEGTVSSPAVSADGKLVFAGAGQNVYAVPNGYGGPLWKFVMQGSVAGGPAVSESLKTVFFGSYQEAIMSRAYLYAINAANGDLRWKFLTLNTVANPTVSLDQKTVFVGSNDGNLYAVNAADGALRWKSATGGGSFSTPAESSDQEMVIVGCHTNLCAINAADGTLRWNFTTRAEVWSSPVVSSDNQAVFVGSNDGNLYAVNVADGNLRWKLTTGDGVSSSPALSLDQKTVFVGSGDGKLYAVNTADGKPRWFFKTGGGFLSSPAVSLDQKTVFVGNSDGTVYAICNPTATGTAGPAHSPDKSIIDTDDWLFT